VRNLAAGGNRWQCNTIKTVTPAAQNCSGYGRIRRSGRRARLDFRLGAGLAWPL